MPWRVYLISWIMNRRPLSERFPAMDVWLYPPVLRRQWRHRRFLMNAMHASGGYPWTVVRVEDRKRYVAALDSASIVQEITPFAEFLAQRIRWSVGMLGNSTVNASISRATAIFRDGVIKHRSMRVARRQDLGSRLTSVGSGDPSGKCRTCT
jgi:hypothetical protein